MKLAIVYDAVYPYVQGGAERRYYELALRLADRGHEVHWYGMWYWDGPRTVCKDGITYHGVCRAMPLYSRSGRRSISQAIVFGLTTLRLVSAQYDVIDCCAFPYFSTFSARVAVGLRGGKLVSTWHEFWGNEYWRSYLGLLGLVGQTIERAAASVSGQIIAVSATTARQLLVACPGLSVNVLHNGVDNRALQRVAPDRQACDLIYVGRLCDYKDIELLLDAVARVAESRPDLVCRIVGGGPHRSTLEAYAAQVGVSERVQFAGSLTSSEEVYAALASARVLVLPSRREGFGIVVVEANALGVPVVVAAHPRNSAVELIEAKNGIVAAPNVTAVASAIDQFLIEPPGERSRACREAGRRYDWDMIAVRYESLLAEVKQ